MTGINKAATVLIVACYYWPRPPLCLVILSCCADTLWCSCFAPHLPRRLDALPQAEVENADHHHQTQGQVPAGEAQVVDASALMEVQHATPAEEHTQSHNCVRRWETPGSFIPVRKQMISMFFSSDVCAQVVVALLLLNTGRVYSQQTAGAKRNHCNSSFVLTTVCG